MLGMLMLRSVENPSGEEMFARWSLDRYFQNFAVELYFQNHAPHERSGRSRWRTRLGTKFLDLLMQMTLQVGHQSGALYGSDLEVNLVDPTLQEKSIRFPSDASLLYTALIQLRRPCIRLGQRDMNRRERCGHAKQYNTDASQTNVNKQSFENSCEDSHVLLCMTHRSRENETVLLSLFRPLANSAVNRREPITAEKLKGMSTIEPVIFLIKKGHRIGQNPINGRAENRFNVKMMPLGFNFRRRLAWLSYFVCRIFTVSPDLTPTIGTLQRQTRAHSSKTNGMRQNVLFSNGEQND